MNQLVEQKKNRQGILMPVPELRLSRILMTSCSLMVFLLPLPALASTQEPARVSGQNENREQQSPRVRDEERRVASEIVADRDDDRDDSADNDNDPVPVRIDLTDLTELVGQKIDIKTEQGFIGNVVVTEIKEGKLPGSIKYLRYNNGTRVRRSDARKIEELYINEHPLDVRYDSKKHCIVHDEEKRATRLEARKAIEEKLPAGEKLWEPLLPEQQAEYLRIHREFLEEVKREMPDIEFQLVETEFYLFYTDLPPEEVEGYIQHLDRMYETLCVAFGIPPTRNIWCGKCVVVAFNREADYLVFENKIMQVNGVGSQGMCHAYPDGKVVFAGFKGEGGFAHVLVHETSHGFVHRYLSSVQAPSWLNEGMADWLAHEIVGGNRILNRREHSARLFDRDGNWQDMLRKEPIEAQMYGAASTVVELLLQLDNNNGKFKLYFDAIKTGTDPEEALKESFGLSHRDLQALYAEAILNR